MTLEMGVIAAAMVLAWTWYRVCLTLYRRSLYGPQIVRRVFAQHEQAECAQKPAVQQTDV